MVIVRDRQDENFLSIQQSQPEEEEILVKRVTFRDSSGHIEVINSNPAVDWSTSQIFSNKTINERVHSAQSKNRFMNNISK